MVNAGALAVMNNVLVPAGLVVNILIWNRDVDLVRLSIGGGVILLSLIVNVTWVKKRVARFGGQRLTNFYAPARPSSLRRQKTKERPKVALFRYG